MLPRVGGALCGVDGGCGVFVRLPTTGEAESPSQIPSVLSLPLSTLLLSFCCYSGNFHLEYHRRLQSVVGEGRMVGSVYFGSVTNQQCVCVHACVHVCVWGGWGVDMLVHPCRENPQA